MFKHASRTFVVHVPYRGASQIIPDVAGGQIPLGVVSAAAGFAQAKAGKIKALASMSAAPPSGMEVVEPLSRVVPGFDIAPQLFFMGPASLTSEFATRIERALVQVCSAPALESAAANLGAVRGWSGQPLREALQQESARFSKIIKEQRIKADS
jgi:tripartite-type tricarboxylate transporter receptor subunit TctC